mgnify:CR=1 FL=1
MVIDRFVHYNLFIIIIINDNKTMIESDEILRKLIELFQKFNTINVWSQITGKNDFQAEYLGYN